MFAQQVTPIAGSLGWSFGVALLPVLTVLLLLGGLRRPAWQAALAGLAVGLIIAVTAWRLPLPLALAAITNGAVFAVWPIMWTAVSALLLYNIAVESGYFEALRRWLVIHVPNDRRVVLVVIGFCFGALLEGIAGFGTPVAITSAMLIMVGMRPLDALTFVLIFDTAPVAFGALGIPVTVLGSVTSLPAPQLGMMIGRQLPFIALILPFYVTFVYGGWRSVRALWPVLLVAGGSFALAQFFSSNYLDYALTDVFASMGSLIVTLLFLKVWSPAHDPDYAIRDEALAQAAGATVVAPWKGWLPWVVVTLTVIGWTSYKVATIAQQKIAWPGLNKAISITLYHGKPYEAVWAFQPLTTGTAIVVACLITALLVGLSPLGFARCVARTARQTWLPIVTVMAVMALAYLMNYSGLAYSLGAGVAATGSAFVFLSPFLGWIAVMLSGSDSSGNALFGNLQVVAARQLNLNPVLFAAANSSGGVMGKMISPQNITTGVSVVGMAGQEGKVFARTFWHSFILTALLSLLIVAQQYVLTWMIPALP